MSSLAAFLADVFLGPPCPTRDLTGCRHRGRGPRSLKAHVQHAHPYATGVTS